MTTYQIYNGQQSPPTSPKEGNFPPSGELKGTIYRKVLESNHLPPPTPKFIATV